ncbi:MAG: MBL fold metallo-hydrolase [Pseudomonadota bacterium]
MPTSSLLVLNGETVLVDCGLGVTQGLTEQGLKLAELRTIIITHLHSDHYLELGPLLHTAWASGLEVTVSVLGPQGLDSYWENFLLSMQADIDIRVADEGRPDLGDLIKIEVLEEHRSFQLGSLELRAIRNDHFPLADSFALSLEGGGKRVVFSGDTAYLPSLAEFAKNADVLVHEAMLEEALEAVAKKAGNGDDRLLLHLRRAHCSAQDAGRAARDANIKCLALHHLIPSGHPDYPEEAWAKAVRAHWQGPLFIGRDGMRIDL